MGPRALVLAVMCASLAGCTGGGTPVAEPSPDNCTDLSQEPAVTLVMKDNEFLPSCVILSGTPRLSLSNEGTVMHNFTLPELQLERDLGAGAVLSVGSAPPGALGPGTYRFFCAFHEPQMQGELRVR